MQVTLNIPDNVVKSLEEFVGPDLGRSMIEWWAVEGYKADKLTLYQVQQLLGFESRYQTEQWLGHRQAWPNWTQEDMDIEFRSVDRFLAEQQS